MFNVENIFIPDSEENEDSQDWATDEGNIASYHCGQGWHKDVHVVGGRLVSSGQSHQQLMLQLIEMSTTITISN